MHRFILVLLLWIISLSVFSQEKPSYAHDTIYIPNDYYSIGFLGDGGHISANYDRRVAGDSLFAINLGIAAGGTIEPIRELYKSSRGHEQDTRVFYFPATAQAYARLTQRIWFGAHGGFRMNYVTTEEISYATGVRVAEPIKGWVGHGLVGVGFKSQPLAPGTFFRFHFSFRISGESFTRQDLIRASRDYFPNVWAGVAFGLAF